MRGHPFELNLSEEDRRALIVKKVAIPQGEATYILCSTAGGKEKERAIRLIYRLIWQTGCSVSAKRSRPVA